MKKYKNEVRNVGCKWIFKGIFSKSGEENVAPASKNLEFIKQCEAQLPKGKKFSRLRAEGASYQAEIFNTITKKTSYNFHTFITFTTFTKTYK